MKLQGRNLSISMQGDDVRLLHEELTQLGFIIDKGEILKQVFGESTRDAVRDFQKKFGLDTSGNVDEKTAFIINQAFDQLQSQPSPKPPTKPKPEPKPQPPVKPEPDLKPKELEQSFVVRGIVRQSDGTPLAGLIVRAFDQDLPSLDQDELLGETSTNDAGEYEIKYTTAQFTRMEKELADLFVRVHEPATKGKDLTPALAQSPTHFNAQPIEVIDVIVDLAKFRGPSEYERYLATLTPLLGKVALQDLTTDDVGFLAGETRIESSHIWHLAKAARFSKETKIGPEAFYGLLRYNLPDALPDLLAQSPKVQRAALELAIGDNVIPEILRKEIDGILDQLHQLAVNQVIRESDAIDNLLGTALISDEQRAAFVSAYLDHANSESREDFWQALQKDSRFKQADVENIKFTMELSVLTLNHLPLVQVLSTRRKSGQLNSLRDLARLQPKDWESLVTESTKGAELPKSVPGQTPAQKAANYATMLAESVEQRFPTAVFANRLSNDNDLNLPHKDDVLTFLSQQQDFELGATPVKSYLAKQSDTAFKGIKDKEGLTTQLEALQRVAHIAPRYDQMRALISKGIDSAHGIAQQSEEVFVAEFAPMLGGETQAAMVHTAAEQKAALTANLLLDLHPVQSQTSMRVLREVDWTKDQIPELRTLFGALDYCACEHCRSVLSPAAYLVDVLEFLRRRPARAPRRTALDVLFKRRPDLGEIELTCENSNTELPYIDLVNELLENAVAPVVSEADWQHLPLRPEKHELFQTRRSTGELQAQPEHLNAAAYATLREAIYPWSLPFDLWNEEARVYLEQLGTTRADLIQTFRPGDSSAVAIARETLDLTATAWNTIADTSTGPARIRAAWGLTGTEDLTRVRVFLEQTGLTHAELIDLFATRFVNPNPKGRVLDIVPPESCDLDAMNLTGLTDEIKSRIHRFVRLWRALAWPTADLDRAIQVLGSGALDNNTLLRLADFKRVQQSLRIPVSEALNLWGRFDAEAGNIARQLNLSTEGLLTLKTLSGIEPFNPANTADTLRFVEVVKTVRASGFSVDDLKLLFLVPLNSTSPLAPANETIASILRDVRASLHEVQVEATIETDPTGEKTSRWLGLLNWDPVVVNLLVRTLTNQAVTEAEFQAVFGDRYNTSALFAQHALAAFSYSVSLATFPDSIRIPVDLTDRLTYDSDARMLRFAGPMTSLEQRRLKDLANDSTDASLTAYSAAIDALFAAPDGASQPADLAFLSNAAVTTLLGATAAAVRFAQLLGALQPFVLRTLGTRAVVQSLAEPLGLPREVFHALLTQYMRSVESIEQPLVADFLETSFAASDTNINITPRLPFTRVFKAYRLLHKAALVLSKFGVSSTELPWLFRSSTDPSAEVNLNLLATVGDAASRAPQAFRVWLRLVAFFKLRDQLGGAKLAHVFELASQSPGDLNAVVRVLGEGSDWRIEDIQTLVTNWRLDVAAFRDERALTRVVTACDLISTLGVSAAQCWTWSEPDLTRADAAQNAAQSIREALKARYTPEQWTSVGKPLRDRLRERQAAALSAYLIAHTHRADGARTWRDTNDLYAYFLVDVEMSACQPMTRIKLAHSTVQLFVQRCLMDLEEEVQANAELDSDWRQWEWMKNYRVWEANRQVFLYPENVIEPELRDDKTDFFRELESDLLKDELTAETAENAFLNYFERLDTVGRLEICAMYRHPDKRSVLHVFGRTRGTPHVYYYRRRISTEFSSSWTPWEKVDVDIEGDYLIPVVWNDRLYIFWPVFLEQVEQQPTKMPKPDHEMAEQPKYTRLQIAWSQLRYNRWTTKTVSEEFAKLPQRRDVELFFTAIPSDGGDLIIRCSARVKWPVFVIRNVFDITVTGITRQVDFRIAGSDGTMRRLPFVEDARFVNQVWGTHLDGMNFVEDQPVVAIASGTSLVLSNGQEGNADQITRWYSPASVFSGIGNVLTAVPAASPDTRASGDHRLRILSPVFGFQTILETLPQRPDAQNRFRILLPHNHPSPVYEFFYQDDTRTFYVEQALDPEVVREVQQLLRTLPEEGLGAVFLRLLVALAAAGSARYQFYSHYHPYVRMLTQRLNRAGLRGLLQRRVQTHPYELGTPPQTFDFAEAYGPNERFVRNYPIEEMDFSAHGAYAQYNWELFFHAPLLIADKLSKNQRFQEAQQWFHTIFDPTDMSNEPQPQRYWRTRPFFERSQESYQRERIDNLLRRIASRTDDPELNSAIKQWRDNPFNPHLVARTRTTAFQRTVVMKYLDNLIAWADQLYRQDTLESINEATQLYILAAEILGPRPPRVTRQTTTPAQTYYQLQPRLDSFSNALVSLENLTPAPQVRRPASDLVEGKIGPATLGKEGSVGPVNAGKQAAVTLKQPKLKLPSDLYFCLLPNAKLLKYWDKIAGRLFNIRHCLDIEGNLAQRSLFGEEIDVELLVRARALGLDLRSALSDLNAPLPQYRFLVLLQKASELCAEVRGFGAALLSAWEKRDAEAMARMRSSHELNLLNQMKEIRKQQLDEAKRALEALEKSKDLISERRAQYARLTAEFTSPGEQENLELMKKGLVLQQFAAMHELVATILHIIPDIKLGVPTSMGFTFGGGNLGQAIESFAKYLGSQASITGTSAAMTATLAGYRRRAEEWDLQIRLADRELAQIDKQIAAAQIRVELAQREVDVHRTQMRQAQQVDDFMRTKFTNQELYDWISRQLADVYFQSYQMAFDMAKRAERSFRFERGLRESSFIQYGYWDSLHKGLMAGERLQLDLRRLEVAYLEQNRREHELTKHISLALHDPFALHLLRTNGSCTFTLPESLFDRDHPGHYMRRIKSVALTLPAVVGPYTSVNCRLTLQSSAVRISPALLGAEPKYRVADTEMSRDTERFRIDLGSVQSIATSRAHSDTGLFEVNFRDERYLPFEGAGAISTWKIEIDKRCNDFDLTTLSDVVMELRYTARDGGDRLRDVAIQEVIVGSSGPQGRLFSARTEFSDAWNAFLFPIGNESDQTLTLDLDTNRFPFRAQQGRIELTELHVVLMLSELGQRHYADIRGGGIRVIIRNQAGAAVNSETAGLLLRAGGNPRVGRVPGGVQSLSPAVRVNATTGANRWQLTVPQTIIDALPAELRAPAVSGHLARIAPEMFDDILMFVVYTVGR